MGGKARLKKTFARADYAATEEDFEEAMAQAMAASQQDQASTSKDEKAHDATQNDDHARDDRVAPAARKEEERSRERGSTAPTGGRRSRSRSRRLSPGAARGSGRMSNRGPQRRSPEPFIGRGAKRRDHSGRSRSRSPHRHRSPHA